MSVRYNSKAIIPGPLITINKQYNKNQDGSNAGTNYSISANGTLLPFRGSPSGNYSDINDAFWTLSGDPPDQPYGSEDIGFNNILRKQEALRHLFSEDGKSFEWQPSGGQPVVKCNPRIISIDFEEGPWVNRCNYTIQLETNWIYINGTLDVEDSIGQDLLTSNSESWSFEPLGGRELKQHTITHEISAQGILGFDVTGGLFESKEAWQHAKDWCDNRASGTINNNILANTIGDTSQLTGHYSKTIRVDKKQGTYSITETWLLSDTQSYIEKQFSVEFNPDTDEYNVTYNGTIYGVDGGSDDGQIDNMRAAKLQVPSDSAARIDALNEIGILIGGQTLALSPSNKTFGFSQVDGTATFNFRWSTSQSQEVATSEDAQYTRSRQNNAHVINFTQNIKGYGNTTAIKLANAKSAIRSDASAFVATFAIIQSEIEGGAFNPANPLSKTIVINEKAGTVRASWQWDGRDKNGLETTVTVQNASNIFASIAIPGRSSGPIIQNMNTQTSDITTVTMRGYNFSSQPDLNTVAFGGGGLIISDETTWSPTTLVAQRTTKFLKET